MINGIPSSSAVRLTEKMMIREPARDLFRMGAALDKFVREECLCWDSSSRYVCHMCAAKDDCEVRCDKLRRIDMCVTNYDLAGLKKRELRFCKQSANVKRGGGRKSSGLISIPQLS